MITNVVKHVMFSLYLKLCLVSLTQKVGILFSLDSKNLLTWRILGASAETHQKHLCSSSGRSSEGKTQNTAVEGKKNKKSDIYAENTTRHEQQFNTTKYKHGCTFISAHITDCFQKGLKPPSSDSHNAQQLRLKCLAAVPYPERNEADRSEAMWDRYSPSEPFPSAPSPGPGRPPASVAHTSASRGSPCTAKQHA